MIEAFRFFLSATYAVSAISKLLHTSEANPLLNAIGIKLRYHPSIVFTLSVAELFVAGGLVWKRTATLAARSSSVLLVIFSGVTVVTLTRGYRGAVDAFADRCSRGLASCLCYGTSVSSHLVWQ